MNHLIPRQIKLALSLSILIIIVISYLAWSSIQGFTHSSKWELHTYKVMTELENVFSELKDIETGTRGYIITGKESFLEPFFSASVELDSTMGILHNEIYDYTLREIKLKELKALIAEKNSIQKEAIRLRKSQGFKVAQRLISSEAGKRKMDEIRLKVKEMMNGEKELLKIRIENRERSTLLMILSSGVLLMLFITATIFVFVFLHKEFLSRERSQLLLRQTYEFTQMIVDTVVSPLVVLDINYNILAISRSFRKTFGYSREYLQDQAFFSLFNGELQCSALKEKMSQVIPQDAPFNDHEVTLSDGRTILINARKLYRPGNHTMMILVGLDDITERKASERKSEHYRRELEKLNQDKDKFFSIIAHDLKSPFTSILGSSELLARESDTMPKDELKEFSGSLYSSLVNVYRLLDDLLQWARIQSGRFQLEIQPLLIHCLLKEIIGIYSMKASKKNITLVLNADESLMVFTDRYSLETVIRNLLSNALKFTPSFGHITISAEKASRNILVSVTDTGIGMEKNYIDKLFSLGHSFTTLGTDNEQGTGIGLLLCRDLIEKLGGSIWAESEIRKGSTFSFTLPCIEETSHMEAEPMEDKLI